MSQEERQIVLDCVCELSSPTARLLEEAGANFALSDDGRLRVSVPSNYVQPIEGRRTTIEQAAAELYCCAIAVEVIAAESEIAQPEDPHPATGVKDEADGS